MPPLPARRRRAERFLLLAALAVGTLLVASCGGGSDDVITDTTTTTVDGAFANADVQVVAEDISFPTKTFRATSGSVTIGYRNNGKIRHTLVIEDVDAFSRLTVDRQGDVAVGTVELEPGEYVLFCDVPGHRASGMEATLTVAG